MPLPGCKPPTRAVAALHRWPADALWLHDVRMLVLPGAPDAMVHATLRAAGALPCATAAIGLWLLRRQRHWARHTLYDVMEEAERARRRYALAL